MPDLQIINRPPSFGENLGQALGGGLGQGLSQGIAQHFQQKQNRQQLEGLAPIFAQMGLPREGIQELIQSGLPVEHAVNLAKTMGQFQQKQQAMQAKAQQDQLAKQEEHEGLQQSIKFLEDNLDYTGNTLVPGKSFMGGGEDGTIFDLPLNRKSFEKRQEFDTTGLWTADKVFTHFNKGTISKEKLKLITEKLAPRANLSVRENRARINAIKKITRLSPDSSPEKVDKVIDHELKKSGSSKEKPPLDSFFK